MFVTAGPLSAAAGDPETFWRLPGSQVTFATRREPSMLPARAVFATVAGP
jgi:hypothetical protein